MSYIRAKYPDTFRWYMRNETQGYGGGKGHNASTIVQIASRLSNGLITREVASDIFASATVADITSSNVQRILNYSNTSIWLESASNIILNTLNSERAILNEIISSGSGNVSSIVSNILERVLQFSGLSEYEDLKADMISRASYFEGENCLDDYMTYLGFFVSVTKIPATIESTVEERLLSFINDSDELFSSQQDPSVIVATIIDRIMEFTNDSLWVVSQSDVSLNNIDTLNTLVNTLSGLFNQGQGNHSSTNNNSAQTFSDTHSGLWAVAQGVSNILTSIISRLIENIQSSEFANIQRSEIDDLILEMTSRADYFEGEDCVKEILSYLEFQLNKSEINNI